MATLDIFKDKAFELIELTEAILDGPYQPNRLGELGWFPEQGIRTLGIAIERKGNTLTLVPSRPRGAPATPKSNGNRSLLDLRCIHLPQRVTITADEVQNIRAFGKESELMGVMDLVKEKTDIMRTDFEVTHEYQRIGAMKGIVLDSDGVTELWDFFDVFGLTQTTHAFAFSNTATDIRLQCHAASRKMEAKLGMKPYKTKRAMCSATFFDALVGNADVKKAFDRWQDGDWLRQDLHNTGVTTGGFPFGGIFWEEYKGGVNGTDFIEANTAYLVPEGVPGGLFKTFYAPADYNDTVNTKGLPMYAKIETQKFDKGVELEAQTNPLHLCRQPDAIVKLTAT